LSISSTRALFHNQSLVLDIYIFFKPAEYEANVCCCIVVVIVIVIIVVVVIVFVAAAAVIACLFNHFRSIYILVGQRI